MLNVLGQKTAGKKNKSNNNKPNQNHSEAAIYITIAVKASIIIN